MSVKGKSKPPEIRLDTPLQYLKGIGPARASAFHRKGVISLLDALYFFPRRYEDRKRLCVPKDLLTLSEGTLVSVLAQIRQQKEIPLRGRKQTLFELTCMGEEGDLLTCTWFSVYKGLKEKLKVGHWALLQGVLKRYRGAPQLVHPEVEVMPEKPSATGAISKSLHWGRVVPIYTKSEKLTQRFIREIIHKCLEQGLPLVDDIIPPALLSKHKFPPLAKALEEMHFPATLPPLNAQTTAELPLAWQRMIYEEFFKFQLIVLMDRAGLKPEPALPMQTKGTLAQILRKNIPYSLTQAQERAIAEVLVDLQKDIAMNRIVQGDVGSGKTFVALFSAAAVLENSHQVALMAPTEILAEQHFQTASKIYKDSGIEVVLLTGSLSRAEKQSIKDDIRSGKAQLVIGTHALIQETVEWKSLAFAIIDEQHRFGVKQRTALKEKSTKFPHILTMTATPIPRSLALTVFGELEVTTIDELPPGRQEIVTKVIRGSDRSRLYNLIRREADEKRQSYIVYPLVNDSDKEGMEKIRSVEAEIHRLQEGPLSGLRLAMVHGQMGADHRAEIMRAFKEHKYDVLISTTVIEVGVDVPNATVMAIENAERFGLSQLHQLRGRVGRGSQKSYCVLVTEVPPPGVIRSQSEDGEEGVEEESPWIRLKILENSSNGFEIAEQDLKIRGPGDFFGTKQSGSPTFQLADLSRDAGLLEMARKDAQEIFRKDPSLSQSDHERLGHWFHRAMAQAADSLKSG